ncbi:hypothetical protein CFC21_101699 [Triticum aestivum]|uniref:DUF1618 domain-containing protein n=2 Tax=Triticum aestivum TaxID=4565 RepID=A0A9R1M3T3_WHEAT|nr:uncharacterized protein LOC123157700 [Triticum aestivum]KAF7100160.1 hypothetical protein CFC21_101698 [Triticum aestivum]KAF7100161.1 hypothetical protein CFC21_101699 [Triticum aestivum]
MATNAGHPAWLLTAAEGYVGDRSNERTATGFTSKGLSIKASFFPNRPPQPSKLWAHCPEAAVVETPRVLCIAGDLILFRVPISSGPVRGNSFLWPLDSDYFVYRADPNLRVLKQLLTDVHSRKFEDCEVGILPRGLHDYTIAALVPVPPTIDTFKLHLFHSETCSWTSMVLPVAEPQEGFDRVIPTNTDLHRHDTSNVITIGGEYGTMGWVDLWRGILFCDVLREKPALRGIPLPLPMYHITGGDGKGLYLGRAMDCRGIAFVNGCLKFVQLDITGNYLLNGPIDGETGFPALLVSDWAISSWTNSKMDNSYKAWGDAECTVHASEVTIKTDMISDPTGMLLLPSEEGVENPEQEAAYFPRLVISDPSPSLDGDGVVYLIAREKLYHPKSWVLALDMNSRTLQSVVPFGIVEDPCDSVVYCTSRSASNA